MATIDHLRKYLHSYVEYVTGQKISPNSNIRCPIRGHNDSSPSFSLGGPNGDIFWRCHGRCNEGGDVLRLFSLIEGYPESNQPGFHEITCPEFAALFGEEYTPPKSHKSNKEFEKRTKIRAAIGYVTGLLDRTSISKYLNQRGWTTKTARTFGIGRLKDTDSVLQKLRGRYDQDLLVQAGLLSKKSGNLPAVLWENERILFTVRNHYGEPAGFSGRLPDVHINNGRPKYVNSPTSRAFTKGHLLYNYHHVRNRFNWVYVVEGQSDVITMWQNGIENVVAPCGTAVTEQHFKLLSEFRKVIVVADLDKAGDVMAQKVMKKLDNCWFIRLPADTDPDSYFWDKTLQRQKHTKEDFEQLDILSPMAWTIEQDSFYHPQDDAAQFLKRIVKLPAVQHDDLIMRLSRCSGIRAEKLQQELDREITRTSFKVLRKLFEKKGEGPISVRVEIGND